MLTARPVKKNNQLILAAGMGKGGLCIATVAPAAVLFDIHQMPSMERPAVGAV